VTPTAADPPPDPTGGYEPATDAHRPRPDVPTQAAVAAARDLLTSGDAPRVRRPTVPPPLPRTRPSGPAVDRTSDLGEAVVTVVRCYASPLRLVLDHARVYLEDDEHGPGSSLLELDRDEVHDLAAGLVLLLGELDRATRDDLGGDPP